MRSRNPLRKNELPLLLFDLRLRPRLLKLPQTVIELTVEAVIEAPRFVPMQTAAHDKREY